MKKLMMLLFVFLLLIACDFGFDENLDDEIHTPYTFFAYQDESSANESVSYEVGQSISTLPDFQSEDGVNRLKAGYYPDGWIFWKNSDTGSTDAVNVDINDGGLVTSFRVNPARATFYASGWSAIRYFVHFDANGGYGSMSDMTMTYDTAATLSANTFARNGYEFRGWSTDSSASTVQYADGATVKNLTAAKERTVNLYALWLKTRITISFDAGGGTGTMSAISATVDETTAPACAFSKANHVFDHWQSTVSSFTYSSGEVLTESKWPNADDTFVACWKPVFELGTPTTATASVSVQTLGSSSVTLTTSESGYCIWSVNGTKVSETSSCTINYSDYPSGGTITLVCLTSSDDVLQYKNTFTIHH